MRRASFKMVAAGDGAPPSPTGYWYYLVAHAIGTVLLLITLVAAVWQFMDWVVAPSECLASSAQPSRSAVAEAAGDAAAALAPTRSYHDVARIQTASNPGECPCP